MDNGRDLMNRCSCFAVRSRLLIRVVSRPIELMNFVNGVQS